MHHLLTNRDPRNEPPFAYPPVHALNPRLSPEIEQVLDHALTINPNKRYQTAAAMKRDIDAILVQRFNMSPDTSSYLLGMSGPMAAKNVPPTVSVPLPMPQPPTYPVPAVSPVPSYTQPGMFAPPPAPQRRRGGVRWIAGSLLLLLVVVLIAAAIFVVPNLLPKGTPEGSPYGYTRPSSDAALSYDATLALLKAYSLAVTAGKTTVTSQDIQQGLTQIRSVNTVQGVSGQISFDATGNAVDKAVVILYFDPEGRIHMVPRVQGKFLVG